MNHSFRITTCCLLASAAVLAAQQASAVTVISDGFGDADINNDGVALEAVDISVQGGVGSTTYIPGRVLIDGLSGEPTNDEVDTVLDSSDTGIRWLNIRGFSDAGTTELPGPGNSKPQIRIVDDTQGAMLETQSGVSGGLGITAINDGYAMSWESRGGGGVAAGFFDQNIALGPEVGDKVRVSFDFRMWRDAPNVNGDADSNNQAIFGDLRFGLYQDTDNQLGMENPFAGRQVDENGAPFTDLNTMFNPAVWGQDEGLFEGNLRETLGSGVEIGARGDAGWQATAIFGDALLENGGLARVREEVNSERLLQGSTDVETIAQPENLSGGGPFDPPVYDFVNLEMDGVYNLALELTRATTEGGTEGDTIFAELVINDLINDIEYRLGGIDDLEDPNLPGINSDNWDYFAIRNASSGGGEFDFLLDNFKVDIEGSNEPEPGLEGDYNGDNVVNAADYAIWRDSIGTPAAYEAWASNFGNTLPAVIATAVGVPEPTSAALLSLFAIGLIGARQRQY